MPGSNGAASSATGVRPARPTIAIDGQTQASLADGLLNLQIVEDTDGLYRCEALFGNWDTSNNGFLYFDRRTLEFGKALAVKIGDDTLFDGRISGLEADFPAGEAPTVAVLAEDRFQDLRMTRRTRAFADVSDSDLFNQIANDHGLTPQIDISGQQHKVLVQVNQSDLAFLRERARAVDAELWMDGRTLHVASRSRRNEGTLRMTHGVTLRAFTVLADLAHQRTSVTVTGWDVSNKSALSEEATESALGNELNNDTSGASILESTLGSRKDLLAHTVPLTSDDARACAEATFRGAARRFVTGRGLADPDANLKVGAFVDLDGLGPLFNGKYYIAEVRYLFDGRVGLRTEFIAERPGLGRPR